MSEQAEIRAPKPLLTVLRCVECGELHRDRDSECMYECDADMEEVEVVIVRRIAFDEDRDG